MARLVFIIILISLAASACAGLNDGLAAYYPLNEGDGLAVHDASGNGYHGTVVGGAKWVTGKFGTALQFNGMDAFIDCGSGPDITSGGTMMIWCRPEKAQGGLVGWVANGSWTPSLMLTVDTYHGGTNTILAMGDKKMARGSRGLDSMTPGEWTLVAFTFDGKTINTYLDGVHTLSQPQPVQPETEGLSLWIGKSLGAGQAYFKGLLDEVRIYNRVLNPDEVKSLYKAEAPARGKDLTLFNRPDVQAVVYDVPAKGVVTVDAQAMQPLPHRASLRVALYRPGGKQPLQSLKSGEIPWGDASEFIFDLQKLPVGKYEARVRVVDASGKNMGDESVTPIEWKGRPAEFRNIKILNNFCWELLNLKAPGDYEFTLPYDRWIFIQNNGDVEVTVDGEPVFMSHASPREGMRFLRRGKHMLRVRGSVKQMVVNAIPQLQHAYYGADAWVHPDILFDWDFLSKDVLPNINVMVAGIDHYRRGDALERLTEWTATGKKWIAYKALPWDAKSADDVYDFWSASSGVQNPLMSGFVIDEANGGDLGTYDYLTEALNKMKEQPYFKGKTLYPYCDVLYSEDRSTKFAREVLANDGWLLWERYFAEETTPEELHRVMRRYMTAEVPKWEAAFPGVMPRMVMVLSNCSEPPESVDLFPFVNYRVCQDMQVRYLATHPAFFGLAGIQWYHAGYSSEEIVRWTGKMYRHYGIEGNTGLLSKDPYILDHVTNPDFTEGTAGWDIKPALPDSVRVISVEDYGSLIAGRFVGGIGDRLIRQKGLGDEVLLTKRSASGPNVFSQEIRNLVPGKAYSLRVITSDYRDLLEGNTRKSTHALSIRVEDAELLSSFQTPVPQARPYGKFTWSERFWLNYNFRTFRAKGKTAKLIISDWENDTDPGGPADQELMWNFVQVQPYLED